MKTETYSLQPRADRACGWRKFGIRCHRQTMAGLVALLLMAGVGTPFAANLLTNPGFENGMAGWALTDTLRGGVPSVVITNALLAHSGDCCVLNSNATVGAWPSLEQGDSRGGWGTGVTIPVADTNFYRLGAWVKLPAEVVGSAITLRYRFEPSGNRNDVGTQNVNTEEWTQLQSDWIKPAAGDTYLSYFEVHGLGSTIPQSFYADDCFFEESAPWVLAGRVVDGLGAGVDGATVSATSIGYTPPATTTAGGGYYSLQIKPTADSYTVTAAKPLYAEGSTTAAVDGATTTAADIVLIAHPLSQVSGKVFEMVGGSSNGVAGAIVKLVDPSYPADVFRSAPSDAAGNYGPVEVVAGRTYQLTASKVGFFTTNSPTLNVPDTNAITAADVEVAQVLPLVSVEAKTLAPGLISSSTNAGSLGGNFTPGGTGPSVSLVNGYKAMQFTGNGYLQLSVGAPAQIIGDATTPPVYTHIAWLYRANLNGGQSTFLSWSPYSRGAMWQYGFPTERYADHWDAGWNLWWNGKCPAAGSWYSFVTVCNGVTEKLYVNGVEVLSEALAGNKNYLNNANNYPIRLGAMGWWDTANPDRYYSGAMGSLQVWDFALDASEVAAYAAAIQPPAPVTHTITATPGTGSTITPPGAVVLDHATQSFSIAATLGYAVTNVIVDGVSQGVQTIWTFTDITTNHTIVTETVQLTYHSLAGVVVDKDNVGIEGATVYFSDSANASQTSFATVTTGTGGAWTNVAIPEGTIYVSAGATNYWNSGDQVVVLTNDVSGVKFTLYSSAWNVPGTNQLLFAAVTESLPNGEGTATGPWARFDPTGGTMSTIGTPRVAYLANQKSAVTVYNSDGYRVTNIAQPNVLPMNGGTITVVCRPFQHLPADAYQCLVSVLLGQFEVCVNRATGRVTVGRKATDWPNFDTGYDLPFNQLSILTYVVQQTGQMQLFINGLPVWSNPGTADFTSISAVTWYATDISVGRGWNGDPWSSFNGGIGDVLVYTNALSAADRVQLETALGQKWSVTVPAYRTITSSASPGATISPSGTNLVVEGTSPVYAITPVLGYSITDVVVDGVSRGTSSSWTFTNVMSDHTIAVTAVLAPTHTISGTVTTNGVGMEGATVYISGTPNSSLSPLFTVVTGPGGAYSQSGVPHGTVYVSAGATGFWNTADRVVLATSDVTGVNFALAEHPAVRNIPAQGDLFIAALTEDIAGADGDVITGWPTLAPAGDTLAALDTPTVGTMDNIKCVFNDGNPGRDGFQLNGFAAGIEVQGVSGVAVVQPKFVPGNANFGAVICLYFHNFVVAVQHDNGHIRISRQSWDWVDTGIALADGQKAVVATVVQTNGAIKLYVNGDLRWQDASNGSSYNGLIKGVDAWMDRNGIGNNAYDSWWSFNGKLGDVLVYKVALSDADREALQAELASKFNIALSPVLSQISMTGGVPTFVFSTVAGYSYRIVYKNNLAEQSWSTIGSGAWTAGTGANMTLTDASSPLPAGRFYRLEMQ